MNGIFWTGYVMLWVLCIVSLLLNVLMLRQYGTMILPGRERVSMGGLDRGKLAPALGVRFENRNRPPVIDWRPFPGEGTPSLWAVLFASPDCNICKGLLEAGQLDEVARKNPSIEFIWVDERPVPVEHALRDWAMAVDEGNKAAAAMDVPAYPWMYIVDAEGKIQDKGVVNKAGDVNLGVRHIASKLKKNARSGRALELTGVASDV
jgi:hypothetical protein